MNRKEIIADLKKIDIALANGKKTLGNKLKSSAYQVQRLQQKVDRLEVRKTSLLMQLPIEFELHPWRGIDISQVQKFLKDNARDAEYIIKEIIFEFSAEFDVMISEYYKTYLISIDKKGYRFKQR